MELQYNQTAANPAGRNLLCNFALLSPRFGKLTVPHVEGRGVDLVITLDNPSE